MRLLRLDSVCSVEHQQLQCSIAASTYSTLKVHEHAQCTQGSVLWNYSCKVNQLNNTMAYLGGLGAHAPLCQLMIFIYYFSSHITKAQHMVPKYRLTK